MSNQLCSAENKTLHIYIYIYFRSQLCVGMGERDGGGDGGSQSGAQERDGLALVVGPPGAVGEGVGPQL